MRRTLEGLETQKPRSVKIRAGGLNERGGSPNGVASVLKDRKGKDKRDVER